MNDKTEKELVQERMAGFKMKESIAWRWLYSHWTGSNREPVMRWLLEIAKILTQRKEVKPDRLAMRYKGPLVLWFHQHWATFEPILATLDLPDCSAPRKVQPIRTAHVQDDDSAPPRPSDQGVAKTAEEALSVSTTNTEAREQDSTVEFAKREILPDPPPISEESLPPWVDVNIDRDDDKGLTDDESDVLSKWTRDDLSGWACEPTLWSDF